MSEMTLRDQFAAAALPALIQEPSDLDWGKKNKVWPERVAARAYSIADAMLKARQEPSQ